ncbi:MAG TPA: hypothetical protein VF407_08350 [Polyangiaceae bacterium]
MPSARGEVVVLSCTLSPECATDVERLDRLHPEAFYLLTARDESEVRHFADASWLDGSTSAETFSNLGRVAATRGEVVGRCFGRFDDEEGGMELAGDLESLTRLREGAKRMARTLKADNAEAVAVVLDGRFGESAIALARTVHVWLVDSVENRLAAERAWESKRCDFDSSRSVTLFDPIGELSEDRLMSLLDTVFDHHPGLERFSLLGVELTPSLTSALQDVGFSSERDADGWIRCTAVQSSTEEGSR